MKKTIHVLLSFLILSQTQAQFKTLAESVPFEEPETGFAKILQLKNGNTMFFQISVKDGIELKIYDSNHKQKASKHIDPKYGKLKNGSIDGIFEINGDATLLVSETDERRPVLNRLVIDGTTGALKKDEKIAELMKYDLGQEYAMLYGHVPPPDFYVRKDPNSNNYAVAMLNSFESDRNKRIEIIFYGQDQQETGRAYYSSPANKYKYMKYIDMAVIGKEKVSVLAYAYNTAASGGKESELVLANLDAGSSSVTLTELDFSKDLIIDGGIARYNPASKKIILLAIAKKKKNQYASLIAYVDPFEKKLENAFPIFPQQANDKCIEVFGRKNEFTGMPQNLFINNDGSFSVVYEELSIVVYSGSNYSTTYTILGNIAVSLFDKDGKETSSLLIPKNQKLIKSYLKPFYHSNREGTGQLMFEGNQYKSFAYVNAASRSYILFNDIEKNAESVKKGKLTTILGVGDCDGFYFPVAAGNAMPDREYVFEKPDSKHEHELGLFAVSDYDKEKNVYVTLRLVKESRHDKNVQLVWMQPQ
jgi:hypothetical protein